MMTKFEDIFLNIEAGELKPVDQAYYFLEDISYFDYKSRYPDKVYAKRIMNRLGYYYTDSFIDFYYENQIDVQVTHASFNCECCGTYYDLIIEANGYSIYIDGHFGNISVDKI